MTAYNILFNALSIQPAQSLAIEGAAGGVGSLLLQLAKAAGLSVTAVAASKHANLLDQLGANQFIPSEKFSTANVKFDVVINAINGGNDQERGVAHVKASGQYLSLNPITEALKQAYPQITMTAFQPKKEYRDRPALGYLTKLMQQKELVVPIAQQFDFNLTNVIVAQSLLEQRHSAGKLIVLKNK
ncbi:zinc-binding dehydrogenase [Loigolactobacillus backii]|uniref:zinc-binding dehydrogenase n=1 Tax=Loigolactobacillus backii TaxID=375175 RepID=UPI003082E450